MAYLVGGVPFGLLFARLLTGQDLRQVGSGNIGATNAMRAGGRKLGALTLLADLGKGALVVGCARAADWPDAWLAAAALAAVLGHISPVYLRFRGGKGVATMFGVLLPWQWGMALVAFGIWLAVLAWLRYVSVASMAAAWSLPLVAWVLHAGMPAMSLGLALAVLVTWRHRENVRRLRQGVEPCVGAGRTQQG